MSEIQTEPAKPKPGRPPKAKATPVVEPVIEPEPQKTIPDGFEVCYVAVPDRVSRGSRPGGATLGKAKPGEKLVCGSACIDSLELNELAFRNEDEAKAAFTMWKRKERALREAALNAEAKRKENKERMNRELLEASELEWNG